MTASCGYEGFERMNKLVSKYKETKLIQTYDVLLGRARARLYLETVIT